MRIQQVKNWQKDQEEREEWTSSHHLPLDIETDLGKSSLLTWRLSSSDYLFLRR